MSRTTTCALYSALYSTHHCKEAVDVFKDGLENLNHGRRRGLVLGVEARVNDAVHIQVQIVEFAWHNKYPMHKARTKKKTHRSVIIGSCGSTGE